MNKKNLFNIFIILLLFFCLIGCAKENFDAAPGNSDNDNISGKSELISHSERKIIYTVSAKVITNNLDETLNSIRNYLNDDEWFDKERHSDNQAYLVIRIKTARLDQFISALSDYGHVKNYSLL